MCKAGIIKIKSFCPLFFRKIIHASTFSCELDEGNRDALYLGLENLIQ